MKFSIIIPVYGTEKYLEQCLQSLLSQDYDDYEIILVDDCSPDNSPIICDRYADKYSQIKVIHKQENEGLGFARNTGVEVSEGEYILFVDSDDTVAPNLLQKCSGVLDEKTDILVFGLKLMHEDKRGMIEWCELHTSSKAYTLPPTDRCEVFAFLNVDKIFPFAWNKVYRAEFLRDKCEKFERTKLIEDFLFNIVAFDRAESIRVISDALYYYRKPAHETLASQYSPAFFELSVRKYELEMGFLHRNGCTDEKIFDIVYEALLKHFISAIIRNQSPSANMSRKKQIEEIAVLCDNPSLDRLVENYSPKNQKYRFIIHCMKKRKLKTLYFGTRCVKFMQTKLKPIYCKCFKNAHLR